MRDITEPDLKLDALVFDVYDAKKALTRLPSGWAILPHLQLINIDGEDANDFLQGQFSNDLNTVEEGQAQLTSYCNPKGRMLGIYWLTRTVTGFGLVVPSDLTTALVKRLTLYKMRAKVGVSVNTESALLGIIGGFTPPILTIDSNWVINDHISLAAISTEQLPILGDHEASQLDSNIWKLANILLGIPQVYAETSEVFIPQQVNLDLVDGVSFSKGCYPGQEIIARIRYLGKIKQRMITASLAVSDNSDVLDIAPGSPIYSEQRGDQKVGTVVDAVRLNQKIVITAMIPSTHLENGELFVSTPGENSLQRFIPSYKITTEKV